MSHPPHEIHLALAEFDRSKLAPDQRELQGEAFALAVRDHLQKEFAAPVGQAQIVITPDRIIIRWDESEVPMPLTERGIDRLKEGDYEAGIRVLEVALVRDPNDADARLNLAIALSDRQRLREAEEHLLLLLGQESGHVGAWVTLGVTKARGGDTEGALEAFRHAVMLDPDDGHARKNLGALMGREGLNLAEAADHLARAAILLPNDPQVWFNLGKLQEELNQPDTAHQAYQRVINLNPASEIADRAKAAKSRLTSKAFNDSGEDGLRADAVGFCLDALRRFRGLSKEEIQEITFEAGMLGARGLDVLSPDPKYVLRTLSGPFSGLHLVCIEYVGFQIIDSTVNIGMDLSREYAEAKRLFGLEAPN